MVKIPYFFILFHITCIHFLLSREHSRHSLGWYGGCLRNHDVPVFHHVQQPGSGLFCPVFKIVQPGLHSYCLPSTVPCRVILARELWREMWQYQARVHSLPVGRSGSCLPTWLVWQTHSSCALCKRCAGVFCSTYARMPAFFSPDQPWGSNFHIRVTVWRPLGTWTFQLYWKADRVALPDDVEPHHDWCSQA